MSIIHIMFSKLIQNELHASNVFEADGKRLLTDNLIYALAFPFITKFGTALVQKFKGGDYNSSVIYICGIFGAVIFLLMTTSISNMIALVYKVIIMALVQLMSPFLIQKLNKV